LKIRHGTSPVLSEKKAIILEFAPDASLESSKDQIEFLLGISF